MGRIAEWVRTTTKARDCGSRPAATYWSWSHEPWNWWGRWTWQPSPSPGVTGAEGFIIIINKSVEIVLQRFACPQAEKDEYIRILDRRPLSDDNDDKKNKNVKEILPLKYHNPVHTNSYHHMRSHHSAPTSPHPCPAQPAFILHGDAPVPPYVRSALILHALASYLPCAVHAWIIAESHYCPASTKSLLIYILCIWWEDVIHLADHSQPLGRPCPPPCFRYMISRTLMGSFPLKACRPPHKIPDPPLLVFLFSLFLDGMDSSDRQSGSNPKDPEPAIRTAKVMDRTTPLYRQTQGANMG